MWLWQLIRRPQPEVLFAAEFPVVINDHPSFLHLNCSGCFLVHIKGHGWFREKGMLTVFPREGLQLYKMTAYSRNGKKIKCVSVKRINVDLTRTCQQAGFSRQNFAHQLLRQYASFHVAPHHCALPGKLVTRPSNFFQPQPYESIVLFHS